LVALLSPGLHVVLQTEASLRRLLAEAGFAHVRVEHDGCSLLAYASAAEFALDDDHAAFRRGFRAYLEARGLELRDDRDLAVGFAGRALFEASNDGDFVQAARLRPILAALCQTRYGLDLATLTALPDEASSCGLARLAELIPLNLAAILYAGAMCDLAAGLPRPMLAGRLDCAADAARQLRRAAGELAMEDAMSEDLAWVAAAEALLCRAAAGDDDVADRLSRFPPAPGAAGAARRQDLVDRVFVTAVNAGYFALAARQLEVAQATPSRDGPDIVFARAMVDLRAGVALDRAQDGFARVRASLGTEPPPPGDSLYWSALRGELHALAAKGDAAGAAAHCRLVAGMMGDAARDMPDDLVEIRWSE
jgi:hypothetical protein